MGKLWFLFSLFLYSASLLLASPQNGVVIEGHATFQSLANGLEIHTGKQTIIDWKSFSIDAGEMARFCQSSSASAVLNRVIGSEKSLINGLLESNGHVFLLNQNGILIGKEGVIRAASFIGSTLDLSNDQFLKGGDLLFKGGGKGGIINLGTIHAKMGDVFLIGYQVENQGEIHAQQGTVGLGQGAEVLLAMHGEERLYIRKQLDASEVGIENDGIIRAAEVELKASGNPFGLAIRHGGEIEATGVEHRNGRVFLITDQGKNEVSGSVRAPSGEVHLLGEEVHLTKTALCDVSGDSGGTILVGGDYQGANPKILNAHTVEVDHGARILADGFEGNGGKVIVWGNDKAHDFGEIFCRALGSVGDGGFVEVSAKSNDYVFSGSVDASSVNGKNGRLLLDPVNIRIRDVSSSSPPFPTTSPGTYKPTGGSTATLGIDNFVPILNSGTDVIIDSTGTGSGDGDITFEDNFSWSGTGNLFVTAHRDLTVENSFSWTGTGNLFATAHRDLTVENGVELTSTTGNMTFTADRNLTVGSGAVLTSTTGNMTFAGLGNGSGNEEGININGKLISTSGAISLTGASTLAGGTACHGIQIASAGNISSGGSITIDGTSRSNTQRSNSHGVLIQGTVNAPGTGTINIVGKADPNTRNASRGIDITGTGSVTASGAGGITLNGTSAAIGGTTPETASCGCFIEGDVSAGTGGISITGATTGTGIIDGIVVEGTVSTISTGPIKMIGTVSEHAGSTSDGIDVRSGGVISSVNGTITLQGSSLGSGTECGGIELQLNGRILSTGTGAIALDGTGSPNGTNECRGVKITSINDDPSSITVHDGNLTIVGLGQGTGSENDGFLLGISSDTTSVIRSTGLGKISINGTGSAAGTTNNVGIRITNGRSILSSNGDIELIGQGGGGATSYGVLVNQGSKVTATGNGAVSLTGGAGTGSGDHYGVFITNSGSAVSTNSGNLSLHGTGGSGASGLHNVGAYVANGGTLSSTSGIVSITGIGGAGTSVNHGVELTTTGTITSPGGLILTGTSTAGANSIGVLIPVGVTALTTGPGAISITGEATGTGTGCHGIQLLGAVDAKGSGSVTIDGTTIGASSRGVLVNGTPTGKINATSGAIKIIGISNSIAGSNNVGIDLTNGAAVATTGGAITFQGSGGAGANGYGVIVQSGAKVTAPNSGTISITGSAGTGSGSNYGILVTDAGTNISANGNLTLDGTGGSGGSGSHNVGAYVVSGGTLSSTTGIVSITGVGGAGTAVNHGVELTTTGAVSSPGGLILNGTSTAGTSSRGVLIGAGVIAQTTGSGSIAITGVSSAGVDSPGIEIGGSVTALGTGNVTLNGTNQGTAATSPGILLTSGTVNSKSGNIQIDGMGNTGGTLSEGVLLKGASVTTLEGGNITIKGTAQDTSGSPMGIGVVNSTLQTIDMGTIDLTTVGGDFTDSGVGGSSYKTELGAFTLTSAEAIRFSGTNPSTVTTTLGAANLTAQGSDLILNDSGHVITGGGDANLTAADHVRLGIVNVTNHGDIVINAGGQVSDDTAAAAANLIGNRAFIASRETGPLPTTLNQLQAVTTLSILGNQSITIANSQALEINEWHMLGGHGIQTANNGAIHISTTAGDMTVTNPIVANGSGTVTLNAKELALINEAVSSTSGAISIAGSGITHNLNGNISTGGTGTIDVTANDNDLTMNPGISFTTAGGLATLWANDNVALAQVDVGMGNIAVTALNGAISNNSGATSPPNLLGNQATLIAQTGIGSGTSSSSTAIGTDLTSLIATVNGTGDIVIFEQSGIDLGAIKAPHGSLDISAEHLIQQIDNPVLEVTNALFTTRNGEIGTAKIRNNGDLLLNSSMVAGDLILDVGTNTLTLNGNSEVGIDYTVTASTYNENGFTVNIGGTSTTPSVGAVNVVTATGVPIDFDLSTATLATTGDITVNLRGGFYEATNPQTANAVVLNSTNNQITNSLTITTTDPQLDFVSKDYNLVNSGPISLGPMQHLIINGAKGSNFTPGISNPNSSPFDNSPLNGGNGSNVTLLNVGAGNHFQGWVSIRDAYDTIFEANSDINTQYINTYGDLTLTSSSGAVLTGAETQTVRTAGSQLKVNSQSDITLSGTVSNLTIAGALNGTLSYHSIAGSIFGPALSQAAAAKIDIPTGSVGTAAQNLHLNTELLAFTAQDDVFIELSGAATVAGNSTSGSIGMTTAGTGDLTIASANVDSLSKTGLHSTGMNGIQIVTHHGALLINKEVLATNGSILLTANGAVTHAANGDLTATGLGTITVNADAGALTMAPGITYMTDNQNAALNASSHIELAQITVGTGDILINSTGGSINRVGSDVNLIGKNSYTIAQSGIGASGNAIQSTLTEFQGEVTGIGHLYLSNTAGLSLSEWHTSGNSVRTHSGIIDVQTDTGNLTVVSPMLAGGNGTIQLAAINGNAAINQSVTSHTGSIVITGQTDVTHGANGTVTVSSGALGTVAITAATGDLKMDGASKVMTQGGDITLLAHNNVEVGEINTGTAGTIRTTAQNGAISDASGVPLLPNFVSNEVILQAHSGIGSGTPSPTSTTDIATNANFLTASTTTGDIVISEVTGMTLKDIATQNGGNFLFEAGGLVTQAAGSHLEIDGNLSVRTARATTLGTVHLVNNMDTTLDVSQIAGNYRMDIDGHVKLEGDQFVGLNYDCNQTGTFSLNGNEVFNGGYFFVNGVDFDLQGPIINATGTLPDFNLDLALPFSAAHPVITINLQGAVDHFTESKSPDAIILNQPGNMIKGTITIETVDPMYSGTVKNDYNLIQMAQPFTLNAGQTLIINAARGALNSNVSGALGSPYGGSTLNGGLGSNINLPLANTVNGVVSIRDPNECVLNAHGNPNFSHVNTYNNLTLTAPSGSITTGALGQSIRSSGDTISLAANGGITIGALVHAPAGEIIYSASNDSITGTGVSQGMGVSFSAPLGGIMAETQTPNCIFEALTLVNITNHLVEGNFGGNVIDGPLTIEQIGAGNLVVNSVTVNGVTRTGLTAIDQPITLINTAAAIVQAAGHVDAGTAGTVNLHAMTGITGIGADTTFQTLSKDVWARNDGSGEIRLENRLNGSSLLSSLVTLTNGPGNGNTSRHLYYSQVGGSSVDFQTLSANGTATLLAVDGSANMSFSENVHLGGDVIAVANHNMNIGNIILNLQGVGTFVLDQESPTLPGSGTFVNNGLFTIPSNNLAIYAASGPLPLPNAINTPPNQIIFGSLAALATWDQALPSHGLDSKYNTSYSAGGNYHGPGFGNNYTPGNGVFGSQVIWYKFDVDYLSPITPLSSASVPFDPRVGINAWEIDYLLQDWNDDYLLLGIPSHPLMLVECDCVIEPPIYQPFKTMINKLRQQVRSE